MDSQHGTALQVLQEIVAEWARRAALPFHHVFVSGSYRLGVHTPDADVDVVLVLPSVCARATHIFGASSPSALECVLRHDARVSSVVAVPGARVPLLGFTLAGCEFDVLTVIAPRVRTAVSREAVLHDLLLLNGMDTASIISLNGARVTEYLCAAMAPCFRVFAAALTWLRTWAQRRRVYCNRAGFFGGVNLALLVARACQEALCDESCARPPAAELTPNAVLARLFRTCARWKWDVHHPYALRDAAVTPCPMWLHAAEWTAATAAPHECMVVLTPCHPRMNSTFSMSTYTLGVVVSEFRRVCAMLQAANTADVTDLQCVLEPPEELVACTRFLRVSWSAPCTASGRAWVSYIEAQARHLVVFLSTQQLHASCFRHIPTFVREECDGVVTAHTYICANAGATAAWSTTAAADVRGRVAQAVCAFCKKYVDASTASVARPPGAAVRAEFVRGADAPRCIFTGGTGGTSGTSGTHNQYDNDDAPGVHDDGIIEHRDDTTAAVAVAAVTATQLALMAAAAILALPQRSPPPPLPSLPLLPSPYVVRAVRLHGRYKHAFDVYVGPACAPRGVAPLDAHPLYAKPATAVVGNPLYAASFAQLAAARVWGIGGGMSRGRVAALVAAVRQWVVRRQQHPQRHPQQYPQPPRASRLSRSRTRRRRKLRGHTSRA